MQHLHSGLRLSTLLSFFCLIISSLILQGCRSSGGGYNTGPWQPRAQSQQQIPAEQTPNDLSVAGVERHSLGSPNQRPQARNDGLPAVKVAILLPLSGKNQKLGQAMLNAAQMALFDLGHDNFQLMPKDTKGTPNGARDAASEAVQEGAQLVLGPLFSSSVKSARSVTQRANINMIAFSTDWSLAGGNTFLIGFLPFDQIERITHYATRAGMTRIGVLSPRDNYGNAAVSAFRAISQNAGVEVSRIERFEVKGTDLGPVLRDFTDYDARKDAEEAYGPPFDAVLMPVGGTIARQVSSFLDHYDLPAKSVKRLGTGLMDDTVLAHDKTLQGTWFAAPAPEAREKFERQYNSIYYTKPPRIATLAYDATALAAILARTGIKQNNAPAFDRASLTNPNGFSGVDGIFRFRPDGIAERGLAVLEIKNGEIVTIDRAPRTFQRSVF